MNTKGPFLFILLIISAFLFRNDLVVEKSIAHTHTYRATRTCELRPSTNRGNNNSHLFINDNTPGQVLHSRIARAVHFIKSNTIISSTALGVRQYLKHTFYNTDDPFISSAELLLFPHHTFW